MGTVFEAMQNKEFGRVNKDKHYLDIYTRELLPYRERTSTILEIGVSLGGSLAMWRKYFAAATIVGIDINGACAQFAKPEQKIFVEIGDQSNPAFLDQVCDKHNNIDIIIDDGSHINSHVIASFEHLFPKLNDGGIYIIEDMCTSYWNNFGGGFRMAGTTIEFFRGLVDHLNFPHIRIQQGQCKFTPPAVDFYEQNISQISFYNGMCFVYKRGVGFSPKSADLYFQ